MKRRYLKVALRIEHYATLCRQADARGLTLSDLVRQTLDLTGEKLTADTALARVEQKLDAIASASPTRDILSEQILNELLLLSREIAADRNAQILARVAQQLASRQNGGRSNGA